MSTGKKCIIGGSIGVLVCIILFAFYLLAYFPMMKGLNDRGYDVNASMFPAFLTGHAFPFLTHFIVEGSPLIGKFCPAVQKECTAWNAGTMPGYEPWVMDNTTGYCTNLIMVPKAECADKIEQTSFIVMSAMLIVVYFLLGVFITWLIPKIKKAYAK